jgi:hypothetical protein
MVWKVIAAVGLTGVLFYPFSRRVHQMRWKEEPERVSSDLVQLALHDLLRASGREECTNDFVVRQLAGQRRRNIHSGTLRMKFLSFYAKKFST